MLFAAAAILAAALIKMLEKTSREYTVFISLAVVLVAVGAAVTAVQPVLHTVAEWAETGKIQASWVQILLKTLGICLLCQTTATVCRDAGESGLAFGVETVCRCAVLLEALPMLRDLAGAIGTLLQGI